MANPSLAAIELIRKQVSDWSSTDASIAEALNLPTVGNAEKQSTIPRPFSVRDFMAVLDAASLTKIQALPALSRLLDDIERADLPRLANWIGLLQTTGTISADQAAAINGIIGATEPDPSWRATIGWAEATLGRPADADDAAAARPMGV